MGWPVVICVSSDSVTIDRTFKSPGLGCERLNLYSDFPVQYKLVVVETCKDYKSVLVWVLDCPPKTTIAQKCDGKADSSQEGNIVVHLLTKPSCCPDSRPR